MARTQYNYSISLLGLVFQVEAQSLDSARLKMLRRWLSVIDPSRRYYPVVPPLFLLGTNDPRVPQEELHDPRSGIPGPIGLLEQS